MKRFIVKIMSQKNVEASVNFYGKATNAGDFYSEVSILNQQHNQKIYGVDPLQALILGLTYAERFIEEQRLLGHRTEEWTIEVQPL